VDARRLIVLVKMRHWILQNLRDALAFDVVLFVDEFCVFTAKVSFAIVDYFPSRWRLLLQDSRILIDQNFLAILNIPFSSLCFGHSVRPQLIC
jgi:hypothetical protein